MGTSSTMLHTSLSAKKSSPVNCRLFRAPLYVEEKGIAAPAGEEAVVTGLRHPCLRPGRDRHALDDDLPVVACPSGLRALNPAKRRGLRPALGGRESHPVRDIGDVIAVRINLEFINRLGREGVGGGGPGGLTPRDGCTFIIRIDLPASPGLGKA